MQCDFIVIKNNQIMAQTKTKEDTITSAEEKWTLKMKGYSSGTLSQSQLPELTEWSKNYMMSHGILVRTKEHPACADMATFPAFTLFPSPVPRSCFQLALSLQQDFNILMHRVANDYDFLDTCLHRAAEVDEFTGRLWQIHETVHKEGLAQPLSLALNRSDYMFCREEAHCTCPTDDDTREHVLRLRQIEFNTIAAGLGCLGPKCSRYHRRVLQSLDQLDTTKNLPENRADAEMTEAFISAWLAYGNSKAVVMFLVFEVERNLYDQSWHEHYIRERDPKVKVIRRTLQDIAARGSLTSDKKLIIDGLEVSVIYLRAGYSPNDYPTEKEWAARLLMERSSAILCPNVRYQLAGTKKVQQMLATPGAVERFLPAEAAQAIRQTFAGLYSLEADEGGDEAISKAVHNPEKYVLKPQREGGGNNKYGNAVKETLLHIKDTKERSAYILMDRVFPAEFNNYAVRPGGGAVHGPLVSELGIFGALVGTTDDVVLNKTAGLLLRSKVVDVDEGGFLAGIATLDSPCLVED